MNERHAFPRRVNSLPFLAAALLGLLTPGAASAADGSPAYLPPLGWNSWNTFFCNIDEGKIRAATDALVNSGMKAAGYQYIVVDDCWQNSVRDASGNLTADPKRFPSGMKALGDYIHSKGLKFGIYQAPREKTCAQYFGSTPGATGARGHEVQDARRFAEWGVDYLKYDWCSPDGTLNEQIADFKVMRDALRATGRPIVYSINSNSIHANTGSQYNWGSIADMWRTTEDITASWDTGCTGDCFMGVTQILDVQAPLASWNGPQHWNDPDMLEVGAHGVFNPTENRAHFSMWAMMASPLIAGNDITTMSADVRAILTDADVLAINQDRSGRQATRVRDDGSSEVWAKTLSDGSVAVALLNRAADSRIISTTAAQVSAPSSSAYSLFDVWAKSTRTTSGAITASVPGHGVAMYRLRVGSAAQTAFSLQGAGSGRCIDLNGGIADNGTRAVIWDCHAGPAQLFSATSGQLMVGGKCLDVERGSTADGAAVITWECNGQPNQQWSFQADGTVRGAQSGKCLDVNLAATANNSPLIIWPCTAAPQQRWSRK